MSSGDLLAEEKWPQGKKAAAVGRWLQIALQPFIEMFSEIVVDKQMGSRSL